MKKASIAALILASAYLTACTAQGSITTNPSPTPSPTAKPVLIIGG